MPRCGSIQNQATSEDASAAATAWLPRDVLASILLRLPTSDLRRYRRVCKEWREVISDPAFVDEHMDHGPQTLTHTIVFFPGKSPAYRAKFPDSFRDFCTEKPANGAGYLLDEHWRVTARFTVSESEDMVGACNGLLCFLDVLRDSINIVEPFTGESITLPLPPKTATWHQHVAYCFGFDPSSRRYKLLHLSRVFEQGLYMYRYTIGEGTSWRSVHVAGAAPGDYYSSPPMIVDRAVYWSVTENGCLTKVMRFDLATEEVTSEQIKFRQPSDPTPFSPVFCVLVGWDSRVCLMTPGRLAYSSTVRLPPWRRLTWPQALQRGQLLLVDCRNGGLYAHPIAPASDDLGLGNLVLQMAMSLQDACKEGTNSMPRCHTRGLFVPVPADEGRRRRVPQKESDAKAYCYAPPLSPAPLANYFAKL